MHCFWWNRTRAGATSDGIQNANRTAAAGTQSSSTDYELNYFHAYKASKTYAISLKNGLHASFDFEHGTATLWDASGNKTTFSLQQVLLQANNGNSQAAAEMYDQMYQDINAAKSDAITASVGPNSADTHIFPPPPGGTIGIGTLGGPLWSTPTGGDCWPVPYPCQTWAGGLSDWGTYNNWWASGLGDPPPTPTPPDPDKCAPNDIDCKLWEHDRQNACDDLLGDNLTLYGLDVGVGVACGTAASGVGALICAAGLAEYGNAQYKLQKDTKKCRTPYQ